eukprot:TRINITY_DN5283_c0_g1_i8.p1 TRINITY_DN5283_c0_g1~~TRINITY_DN5283_c0_g1_i8.p1  ORF type:complete len:661 (+),score=163.77 TRINITY_DN5283_c0_g1_i8:192-1985(+)
MKVFGVFIFVNALFIVFLECVPSVVVHSIFLAYIVLAALPKFIFGSLLIRFKPKAKFHSQADVEDDGAEPADWHISRAPILCPGCNRDCTTRLRCDNCHKEFPQYAGTVVLTACITVYHEDAKGLNDGVNSFELSTLSFDHKRCNLVFIVDGRYDRSEKVDLVQRETAVFLLARLYGVDKCQFEFDDDAVPRFKEGCLINGRPQKCPSQPYVLDDGVAVYTGQLSRGMPFTVLLKRLNQGKRHSHELFFHYMHTGQLPKTVHSIMFVDSDVEFAWKRNRRSMDHLYHGLIKNPSIGGACGEIEVMHWYQNPLTMTQYFEYKSNQFLAKTAESWFGMVTCLPGAFCMVRPKALEQVLNVYLAVTTTIWNKNQLDLGEDRTLTTQLLQGGWNTVYVQNAVARTQVPSTLIGLIKQRRRWINSTVVNMVILLRHVHRLKALPLLLALGIELISSFTLPTAMILLLYDLAITAGLHATVSLAIVILWIVIIMTLSLTTRIEQVAYWFHVSSIISATAIVLFIILMIQNYEKFIHKGWLELVVLLSWFGIIIVSSIIHRQWFSVLGVVAPVAWLLLCPTMYIVVPLYAVCNFDDLSWGTRGA